MTTPNRKMKKKREVTINEKKKNFTRTENKILHKKVNKKKKFLFHKNKKNPIKN